MKNGSLDKSNPNYISQKGVGSILNPTIRSKIIFGVAATMKKVHANEVIHRNLNDASIFLDDRLEPQISDFGLSKVFSNDIDMTMEIGAPYTMAPEIFMGDSETYDQSVDVFSYAFLLYKMFTNTIQFKKDITTLVYMREIGRGNRPIRPPDVPDHYWELINKCWAQEPAARPSFSQITEILRDDIYALEEFGMTTNLDELHEYQNRIDNDDYQKQNFELVKSAIKEFEETATSTDAFGTAESTPITTQKHL